MLLHELDEDKNPARHYVLGNEYIGLDHNYYLTDEQGSVRYVLDAAGNVQNDYRYDAFGQRIAGHENIPNCLRYNAQIEDDLTGLYYLRARYYNTGIGRFTQEDVIYNDGLNLYAYCNSNPVMYADPSGYQSNKNQGKLNPCEITKSAAENSKGGIPSKGHTATWKLLDEHGNVIGSGVSNSGGTHPGRVLTWDEQLKTHTEYKILEELKVNGKVSPGSTIVISGTRPPCNPGRSKRPSRGCQKAMQDFANAKNVNILYFKEGDSNPWIFPR